MKARLTQPLITAALCMLAGIAAAQEPEAPVAVNVEGLPQQLRARIEKEARKGPTAVIQYINRTRHLHNLRAEDVIKSERAPQAAGKKEEVRVADRVEAPKP